MAGNMNTAYFPSLAQYFVDFVQAYQQQGIPIYASLRSERAAQLDDRISIRSACRERRINFHRKQSRTCTDHAGLGSVKIFGYEHNWDNTAYPESVLGSPASQYVAGSSFHCYAGDPSAQSNVETAFPAKDIWFTECSGTVGSTFAGDLVWQAEHLLIGATRNWARSVSLWNLALDQNSGPHQRNLHQLSWGGDDRR